MEKGFMELEDQPDILKINHESITFTNHICSKLCIIAYLFKSLFLKPHQVEEELILAVEKGFKSNLSKKNIKN